MNASNELKREDVVEIMRGERFVMLSVATNEAKIVSHPMTPQEVTELGEAWFFIGLSGDQADAIRANPQVNLAFAETGSWLSLSGTAEFIDDRAKIEELWDGQVDSYFEGGKDDPDLGLMKVSPDSVQFWGVRGRKAATAVKILASKIRGTEGPGGTATTEL